MNKYKTIQIVCWLIVFFVFVGLAIWFAFGPKARISNVFELESLGGPYEEEGRYSIDGADIRNLTVDWTAGEVTVIPSEGNKIELVEYARRELKEEEKLVYAAKGNSLSVNYCERHIQHMPAKKLEIFIPKKLTTEFKDFILEGVSAELIVSDITADLFRAETVSGEVQLTGIKAEEMELESTSGSMRIKDSGAPVITISTVSGSIIAKSVTAEEVTAESTSGEISFDEVQLKKLEADTQSGEITFVGSFEKLTADSASGEINITEQTAPQAFDIKTISGEVSVKMPAVDGLSLYNNTISGSFHSEIPVRSANESEASFRIETTSGSIKIKELK